MVDIEDAQWKAGWMGNAPSSVNEEARRQVLTDGDHKHALACEEDQAAGKDQCATTSIAGGK